MQERCLNVSMLLHYPSTHVLFFTVFPFKGCRRRQVLFGQLADYHWAKHVDEKNTHNYRKFINQLDECVLGLWEEVSENMKQCFEICQTSRDRLRHNNVTVKPSVTAANTSTQLQNRLPCDI